MSKQNIPIGYETGICNFAVVYRVTTTTSGTELLGPSIHYGDFKTGGAAAQALVDDPRQFSRKDYAWVSRDGYTRAYINRFVLYDYPNPIRIKLFEKESE